jgi:hypothetical protein
LRLRESARFQRARAASSAQFDPTGTRFDRREADEADRVADAILTLPDAPAIGAGGELHLSRDDAAAKPGLACTVTEKAPMYFDACYEWPGGRSFRNLTTQGNGPDAGRRAPPASSAYWYKQPHTKHLTMFGRSTTTTSGQPH